MTKKQLIKALLVAVGTIALISTTCGGIAYWITDSIKAAVGTATLTTFVQVMVGYGLSVLRQQRQDVATRQLANWASEVTKASSQTVDLPCAYCRTKNKAQISLHVDNVFDCTQCKQTNIVMMEFSTSQMTKPVDYNSIEDQLRIASNALPESIKVNDVTEPVTIMTTQS